MKSGFGNRKSKTRLMPFVIFLPLPSFYIILILFIVLFMFLNVYAQPIAGDEYQIKAGFIYNFAKFTKWPSDAFDDADNTIILCVISDYSSDGMFALLNNKMVRGRKIIVKNFQNKQKNFQIPFLGFSQKNVSENKNNMEKCHILFFASKNKVLVKEKLRLIKDKSVLTIGETEDFTDSCGIINFFTQKNRLQFKVNLKAAKHARLKLSSQLMMSAAEIIRQGCGE